MLKRVFQSIFILSLVAIFLVGCNPKLDQRSMFHGRKTTNKKKGHYDTGVRRNKPMSIQIAEDLDKQTKHDTNPKKAARKVEKERLKKKAQADKARAKHNKKVRTKLPKVKKSKSGGGEN